MHRRGGVNGSALLAVLSAALLLGGCAHLGQDVAQERLRYFTDNGNDRFQQGAYDRARQSYEVALQLKPGDADLLYHIGQCHQRLGQPDQAEHTYQEGIRRSPDHGPCRQALIALLVQQQRFSEAEQAIGDWMARAPTKGDPYIEDALLAEQRQDFHYAMVRCQQALDVEPRNPRALVEVGRILEEWRYPERALVLYERALDDNPNQPELRRHVAEMHARGVGPPRPN